MTQVVGSVSACSLLVVKASCNHSECEELFNLDIDSLMNSVKVLLSTLILSSFDKKMFNAQLDSSCALTQTISLPSCALDTRWRLSEHQSRHTTLALCPFRLFRILMLSWSIEGTLAMSATCCKDLS